MLQKAVFDFSTENSYSGLAVPMICWAFVNKREQKDGEIPLFTKNTLWTTCRDYLGDTLHANAWDFSSGLYGYGGTRTPIDKDKCRIGLSHDAKCASQFREAITKVIGEVESANGLGHLELFVDTKSENFFVVEADPIWQSNTVMLSWFLLLIRMTYKLVFSGWSVSSLKDLFVLHKDKFRNSSDASYISNHSIEYYLRWLNNLKQFVELSNTMLGEKKVSGYGKEIATGYTHSWCGINAAQNLKDTPFYKVLKRFEQEQNLAA